MPRPRTRSTTQLSLSSNAECVFTRPRAPPRQEPRRLLPRLLRRRRSRPRRGAPGASGERHATRNAQEKTDLGNLAPHVGGLALGRVGREHRVGHLRVALLGHVLRAEDGLALARKVLERQRRRAHRALEARLVPDARPVLDLLDRAALWRQPKKKRPKPTRRRRAAGCIRSVCALCTKRIRKGRSDAGGRTREKKEEKKKIRGATRARRPRARGGRRGAARSTSRGHADLLGRLVARLTIRHLDVLCLRGRTSLASKAHTNAKHHSKRTSKTEGIGSMELERILVSSVSLRFCL